MVCSQGLIWGPLAVFFSLPRCPKWPRYWIWLTILLLSGRIGEATVPGPQVDQSGEWAFTLGVCNPNGLVDKPSFFAPSTVDLWLICETHLTVSGMRNFDRMLGWQAPQYTGKVFGHPVLARSEVSDVGRWSGVGMLSQWPIHRLPHEWPSLVYNTGRISVSTTFLRGQWISGCVVYGTPTGPTHHNARQTTDQLLEHALCRVLQLSGPRFVGGDFNHDHDRLITVTAMRQIGFVDIQDLHAQRAGCYPVATCRNKTRRDFLFVSPELAAMFRSCSVQDCDWSDHSLLVGHFACSDLDLERFPWPRPDPVDWSAFKDRSPSEVISFQVPNDATEQYARLWADTEQTVQKLACSRGQPLPARCFGRAGQCMPGHTTFQVTPLRAGRSGDIRPSFMGFSHLHRLWFRQLRRLESYTRLVRHGVFTWQGLEHRACLWQSIVGAVGFRPSFPDWWCLQGHASSFSCGIPLVPPAFDEAIAIFEGFKKVVRSFENHLKKHNRYVTSFKRAKGLNAIYGEVKRDKPVPVSIFVPSVKGIVTRVELEDGAVEFGHEMAWRDDEPFIHQGRSLQPHMVTGDKLWCEDVTGVAVGDEIIQSCFQGRLSVLFEAFHEQWRCRWLKHPQVEPSQWQQILDFASSVLQPVPVQPPMLDLVSLKALISSKSKRAGIGLDGVSQMDLAAMDSHQLSSLLSLYQRAELDGEWPRQCMAGSVQSLAKVEAPTGAGDYRPVTVLGLVYRLWSSFHSRFWLRVLAPHLDEHLCGNRPGHRPADVWRYILLSVDQGFRDRSLVCGFVVDLVKAYNTLPRYPVLFASKLLGISHNTLTGWAGALAAIRRHFAIRGSYSKGLLSTTGLPEGCGLSCLGMLVLDMVLHRWMTALNPDICTLTFVDNWEVLVRSEEWLLPAFDRLSHFVRLLDLELDSKKTYYWSTSGKHRAVLRQEGCNVRLAAKDLGAHVAYSRQLSNQFLADRLRGLGLFWERLAAAPGSHARKVKVILSAAWPRAFHACSAAILGRRSLDTVRSLMMRTLKLQKPGASPWLQGALEVDGFDPLQWILTSSIRDFRDDPRGVLPCSCLAVDSLTSESYTPGSVQEILVQRIHKLGWRIVSEVEVEDELGIFDLRQIPIQSLYFRLQWAWTCVVARQVQHRASFSGFAKVDRGATRASVLEETDYHQGILRRFLNGTDLANDKSCFWSEDGSHECPLCHEPDSVFHRLWQCSGSDDLRGALPDVVLKHVRCFPEVLSVHGWTLASPWWTDWIKLLLSVPASVPASHFDLPSGHIVDLFTDGSCLWPSQPRYRLASWAVVWSDPLTFAPAAGQCRVLAASPLSGETQTAYRAELMALRVACSYVVQFKVFARIWTDCKSVLSRFHALTQGTKQLRPNHPHVDLWQDILDAVTECGVERIALIKVPAHEQQELATDAFESWMIHGNMAADHAARMANISRPEAFWQMWERHVHAVHCNNQIGCWIRKHMVHVALRWNEARQGNEVQAAEPVSRRRVLPPREWCVVDKLEFRNNALYKQFGQAFSDRLLQWFNQIWSNDCQVEWVSFTQLFVLYQMQTKDVGAARVNGHWLVFADQTGATPQQFNFALLSKWFRLAIQKLLKTCGVRYRACCTRPKSNFLQCHLGSLAVPLRPNFHELVEVWLSKVLVKPVRGQGTHLTLPLP